MEETVDNDWRKMMNDATAAVARVPYPHYACPVCGDWFHMPFKFCKCKQTTLTVDRVPDWVTPTDFIEQRGEKTFFVSQSPIRRWRKALKAITCWWRLR